MTALERLAELLRAGAPWAVAFSGGADSRLLAEIAARTLPPDKLLLVNAHSCFNTTSESSQVSLWQHAKRCRIVVVEVNPLSLPEVKANPVDRCYHCKKLIFTALAAKAREFGIETLADGTVLDDLGEERPGLRAAAELGVRHPLAEAGFAKKDARLLARQLGLPNWNTPNSACLATRLPHGTSLDAATLARIGKAEALLVLAGHPGARARLESGTLRLELNPLRFHRLMADRRKIMDGLKSLGFDKVCLDLDGYKKNS